PLPTRRKHEHDRRCADCEAGNKRSAGETLRRWEKCFRAGSAFVHVHRWVPVGDLHKMFSLFLTNNTFLRASSSQAEPGNSFVTFSVEVSDLQPTASLIESNLNPALTLSPKLNLTE